MHPDRRPRRQRGATDLLLVETNAQTSVIPPDAEWRHYRRYGSWDASNRAALIVLDCRSGSVLVQTELAGVPDVIFFNHDRRHLYVAIDYPELIEVFETDRMRRVDAVRTEPGASLGETKPQEGDLTARASLLTLAYR